MSEKGKNQNEALTQSGRRWSSASHWSRLAGGQAVCCAPHGATPSAAPEPSEVRATRGGDRHTCIMSERQEKVARGGNKGETKWLNNKGGYDYTHRCTCGRRGPRGHWAHTVDKADCRGQSETWTRWDAKIHLRTCEQVQAVKNKYLQLYILCCMFTVRCNILSPPPTSRPPNHTSNTVNISHNFVLYLYSFLKKVVFHLISTTYLTHSQLQAWQYSSMLVFARPLCKL